MAQPASLLMESSLIDDPSLLPGPLSSSLLAQQKRAEYASVATPGLPSPPLSCTSADGLLDFDTAADFSFESASSPQSSVLVSPKSTPGASFTFEPNNDLSITEDKLALLQNDPNPSSTVEALSQHHLERYLHYKALAAQAQAELSYSLFNGRLMADDSDSSLKSSMLALQNPSQQTMFSTQQGQQSMWNQSLQYQQVQQAAAAQQQVMQHAQVQAQVHLQQAQAVAAAHRSMSMGNYFMPTQQQQQQAQSQLSQTQPPSMWSRPSAPASVSTASPPYPSTPTFTAAPGLTSMSGAAGLSMTSTVFAESKKDIVEEDELSQSPVNMSSPVANMHGGGRGYTPGKTPDDPKKRHKCQVCGRGFARAFNLKSHISTHDPLRPKPHQCPHPMCKRSFSRLHDLERHRQGIHSDGPLVDAKRQGVSPGVIRAQSRMRSRAESGGLI